MEEKELKQNYDKVCKINLRWQIYDKSREQHVCGLHATIEKLQAANKKLSNQQTELKKDQIASSCVLDAKLARKEKEVASLTDRNECLEAQIASMKKSESKKQHRSEERITLYQKQVYLKSYFLMTLLSSNSLLSIFKTLILFILQLDAYTEDFNQERSHRKKLDAQNQSLMEDLVKLSQQVQKTAF
jgi:cell division protein FtsB